MLLSYTPPYPLNYGVYIVPGPTPDNHYKLLRSKTLCFPFTLGEYNNILVAAKQTTYQECYIPFVRMWPSLEPNGNSISASPNAQLSSIKLFGAGFSWNFFDIEMPQLGTQIYSPPVDLNQWISRGAVYFINVQNLQNKDDNFYLKFTYCS
jgi:hypothetical protein